MKRAKDFTGLRFHKLVAVRLTGRVTPSGNAIWEMRCDCGGTRFADTGSLTGGKAKSCGCALKTQHSCSVAGCDQKAHSRHLCNRHYKRWQLTGDPTKSPSGTSFDVRERFLIKTKRMPNGCLEWIGTIGREGYGQTSRDGRKYSTHRLAWELANGPIPHGFVVCHKCDNRRCVDISHLFVGTQGDNIRDAWSKGRGRAPWQKI